MRCAHEGIFLKTLPLKLTETLNASIFVSSFLNFQFQSPKFRREGCFTLSLNYAGLYKERSSKQVADTVCSCDITYAF